MSERVLDPPGAEIFGRRKRLYQPYGKETLSPFLHTETSRTVKRELAQVASFLNKSGIPWFLAGGTALDLARGSTGNPDDAWVKGALPTFITGGLSFDRAGTITRDHTDFDVVIFDQDAPAFFHYADNAGYRFEVEATPTELDKYKSQFGRMPTIRHLNKYGRATIDINTGKELQVCPSPYALPREEHVPVMDVLDLDIARKDPLTGDVFFNRDLYPTLTIPFDLYDTPKRYQAINGETVPLQPAAEIVMHKLLSGRVKDLLDIKMTALTPQEHSLLKKLLEDSNLAFRLSTGETIATIHELIVSLEPRWMLKSRNLLESIQLEKERLGRAGVVQEIEDVVFGFIGQSESLIDLRELVQASYGPLALKRFGSALRTLYTLLPKKLPDKTTYNALFTQVFDTDTLLGQLATDVVLSQQLWEVVPQGE